MSFCRFVKPTLLNKTVNGPYVSTVYSTASLIDASSPASRKIRAAIPPCWWIHSAADFAPSSLKSPFTTLAPSLPSTRAVASPIPDAPPVTNAIFPSTLLILPTSCKPFFSESILFASMPAAFYSWLEVVRLLHQSGRKTFLFAFLSLFFLLPLSHLHLSLYSQSQPCVARN